MEENARLIHNRRQHVEIKTLHITEDGKFKVDDKTFDKFRGVVLTRKRGLRAGVYFIVAAGKPSGTILRYFSKAAEHRRDAVDTFGSAFRNVGRGKPYAARSFVFEPVEKSFYNADNEKITFYQVRLSDEEWIEKGPLKDAIYETKRDLELAERDTDYESPDGEWYAKPDEPKKTEAEREFDEDDIPF